MSTLRVSATGTYSYRPDISFKIFGKKVTLLSLPRKTATFYQFVDIAVTQKTINLQEGPLMLSASLGSANVVVSVAINSIVIGSQTLPIPGITEGLTVKVPRIEFNGTWLDDASIAFHYTD